MSTLTKFNDVQSNDIKKKQETIRKRLETLNYKQPFYGNENLDLIDRLTNDIIQLQQSNQEYQDDNSKLLKDKENEVAIAGPLRNENMKLFNEKSQLQKEIIRLKNENNDKLKEYDLAMKSLNDRILEFNHLLSEKDYKIKDTEREYAKLNKKFSEVLEKVYGSKQVGLENIEKVLINLYINCNNNTR